MTPGRVWAATDVCLLIRIVWAGQDRQDGQDEQDERRPSSPSRPSCLVQRSRGNPAVSLGDVVTAVPQRTPARSASSTVPPRSRTAM